eukprot:CAMPEP_0176169496 /NCGR_PEP_ID=MMETSP0120_2-20121206/86764_1 /TAXON_ID=160619 /ORGANISM="Kryptoperidinium foliaceum, Strain CCMP 1326" /LENGTH=116 /DNA_ID=CAMNT_0017507261 /DNA_START=216 /DNA_END=562 /DNA_ORIENTATION=+
MFFAFIPYFLLTLAVGEAGEPVPLGETPPLPEESSHVFEVIKQYQLPHPEEVALDPTKKFFLTGTNDGYVLKVDIETGEFEPILAPYDFRPDLFMNQTDEEARAYCDGTEEPVKGP